jgi:hypothetical protein
VVSDRGARSIYIYPSDINPAPEADTWRSSAAEHVRHAKYMGQL